MFLALDNTPVVEKADGNEATPHRIPKFRSHGALLSNRPYEEKFTALTMRMVSVTIVFLGSIQYSLPMFFARNNAIAPLLALSFLLRCSPAQTLPLAWVKTNDGSQDDYGWDVAADDLGNCYAAGYFTGAATCGGKSLQSQGDTDGYLIKYSANGDPIWVAQVAGDAHDDARAVTLDKSGNIYLAGHFSSTANFGGVRLTSAGAKDIFLARYDQSGHVLWLRRAGGSGDDIATGVAADGEGNIYVTGSFSLTADFGTTNLTSAGRADLFLAKYTPGGDLLWARQAGGPGVEEAERVRVDRMGNVYVAGFYQTNAVFQATPLPCSGYSDMFLAKYSPLGDLIWLRTAGGTNADVGGDVAADAELNVYVVGVLTGNARFEEKILSAAGEADMFVAKYDSHGALAWVQAFGGDGPDQAYGIAVDSSGDVYVTGFYLDAVTFGQTHYFASSHADFVVIKLHPNGKLSWTAAAQGTAYSNGKGIAVNSRGEVFATGYFRGSSRFDSFFLTNLGDRAAFVTKINPPPRLEISRSPEGSVLRWPAAPAAFQLEENQDLAQSSSWAPAQVSPATIGQFKVLTNTSKSVRLYFRLRQ